MSINGMQRPQSRSVYLFLSERFLSHPGTLLSPSGTARQCLGVSKRLTDCSDSTRPLSVHDFESPLCLAQGDLTVLSGIAAR